jgi:hypothetical protein
MLHIHTCYKRMFQLFQMFHTYVASVLSGCCICFAMAVNVFPGISDVCCKCFNCFGRMLQVFLLDVVKGDLGVAHVVGLICNSHLLQLLGSPACACVERVPRCGCGTRSMRGPRYGARDTKRQGTRCGRETRSDADPHVKQA